MQIPKDSLLKDIIKAAHGFKDYDGEYFPDVAFKHLIRGYDNRILYILACL